MWYRPNFTLGAGAGEGAGSKRNAQLQVRGLQAGYGPIAVLRGVSFDVKPGLTVILGPNETVNKAVFSTTLGLLNRFVCIFVA
jgi:branched-chain amino acid transport system ATP-binding protein